MPSKDDNPPPPPAGAPKKDDSEDRVTGQDVKACFKVSETKPNGDYRWHCLSCTALGWATPSAISHLKSCQEALKRPDVQRVLRLYKPRYRKSTAGKDDATPGKEDGGETQSESASNKKPRLSGDPNKITGKDVRSCMKVNGEKKPNGDYRWTCLSCSMSGWSTAEAVTHLKGCKEALKRPEVQRVVEGYKPRSQRQSKAPQNDHKHEARSKKKKTFKEVAQTDLTPNKGNALQACVASILGLDLEDVPNFIASSGDMYDSLRDFLSRRSLGFMKIALDSSGSLPFAPSAKKTLCILSGDSPRPNQRHVVVAEIAPGAIKASPFFDPHPTKEMLKTHTWVGLFVALDPANVE